jgi:hypothetical protein
VISARREMKYPRRGEWGMGVGAGLGVGGEGRVVWPLAVNGIRVKLGGTPSAPLNAVFMFLPIVDSDFSPPPPLPPKVLNLAVTAVECE